MDLNHQAECTLHRSTADQTHIWLPSEHPTLGLTSLYFVGCLEGLECQQTNQERRNLQVLVCTYNTCALL